MIKISNLTFNDISYKSSYELSYIASKYNINNNSLKRIISKKHNNLELTNIERKAIHFIQANCVCTYAYDWQKVQVQEFSRLLGVNVNLITSIVNLYYEELSTNE